MPIESEIDVESRLVRVRAWGVVTYAEVMATRLRFTSDPGFSPTFFQLYDLRDVTKAEVTPGELRQLATDVIFSAGSRRAVVSPRGVVYGFARMFATYREINGGLEKIEVFRSIGEANEWLGLTSN